jgi:hypothetical protein
MSNAEMSARAAQLRPTTAATGFTPLPPIVRAS